MTRDRHRATTDAQPPIESAPPTIEPPASRAAGWGAIEQTVRHTARHMGALRGAITLLRTNQKEGFDCPGCAWPEPRDRSAFEFCENGAKAVASEATTRSVTPAFFAKWSVVDLAKQSDFWLNEQGRIAHPVVLRKGATHYEPIAWDDAYELVAAELRGLAFPDQAAFYTSGRTSNEAAFLYQLFARQLGTNNLPDCSNMCHESTGEAMGESLGVGKGTVTLEDFALADAIFVVGQNPGTNHPRMLTTLGQARERGCTLVAINPLIEPGNVRFAHPQDPVALLGGGGELANLFLQVRINGDVAAFKGIMKAMLEREAAAPGTVLDHRFLREHTEGFEAFAASLAGVPWDAIVTASGVPKAALEEAARVACEAERTIVCWAMGLTQHKNAVANIQEIVNFLLLRGNIGKPGAGACPVRGHSNVQGDRTMGIWEKMPDAFLDRLGAEFGFEPPRQHGHDTVGTIRAMVDREIKVFFAMGGNFLSASPDTERTAEALRGCRLTAHVSTKLHRGHLVTGETALILPCLGRTELDETSRGPQFVTVENSMSVVSRSRGTLKPASDTLRSEVAIIAGLARATLGARSRVAWDSLAEDYDRIRDHIARVVPGCADYNARVREPAGFYLGNAARDRVFATPTKKARFAVHPIPRHDLPSGRLLMMTIRSHDQYNTTIYGLDDRYRGIKHGRRVVLMNAEDLRERGLAEGDLVDLVSHFEDGERRAEHFRVVAYAIPRQCAATYFPEGNVLVPLDSVAERSNTPTSKSVVITVKKSARS
ncbi:MAG: FdhF/YdeP family oxidoreductase [Myxococcota bacterium]|nr:FdhF/YdeP family oxidoreductase [Myxococcota bacterium]